MDDSPDIARAMRAAEEPAYCSNGESDPVREIGDWERPPIATIPEYLMSRSPFKLGD